MSVPYFPMYPTDFEADTSHLTLEEDGAYNRMLRLMWMTPGCSLPDDERWIMRRMRCDKATFDRVVSVVIDEFLSRKNGRLYSARLSLEWKKVDVTSRKRSEAGKKGGRPKTIENTQEDEKAGFDFDKAGPKQPEPEPEPDPEVKNREAKASLVRENAKQAVSIFNEKAALVGWSQVVKLTDPRLRSVTLRLDELGGLDGWRDFLEKASQGPHLCGENNRGWTADFDWLIAPKNMTKVLEGNYDRKTPKGQTNGHSETGAERATRIAAERAARRMDSGESDHVAIPLFPAGGPAGRG